MRGTIVRVDEALDMITILVSSEDAKRPAVNQMVVIEPAGEESPVNEECLRKVKEEYLDKTENEVMVDKLVAGVDALEQEAMLQHWHATRSSQVRIYAQLRRQIRKQYQGDLSAKHAELLEEEG